MIKLPLSALPSMIKLLAFNFSICPLFSAFSFLQPKFSGFWLLALDFPDLAFFQSKIKKNRQKAKS